MRGVGMRGVPLVLAAIVVASSAQQQQTPQNLGLNFDVKQMRSPLDVLLAAQKCAVLGITNLKLFHTDICTITPIFQAYKSLNSSLKLTVAFPNELLARLAADPQVAKDLVAPLRAFGCQGAFTKGEAVPMSEYAGQTRYIQYIAVGNEPLALVTKGKYQHTIGDAATNVYNALREFTDYDAEGAERSMKMTVPFQFGCVNNSYPPLNGTFAAGVPAPATACNCSAVIAGILPMLHKSDSAFSMNIYPVFARLANKHDISLIYALGAEGPGVNVPETTLVDGIPVTSHVTSHYDSLLQAQFTALTAALGRLGYTGDVIIGETGWPTAGESAGDDASIENAERFSTNAVRTLTDGPWREGSPEVKHGRSARPQTMFLFEAFDEERKPHTGKFGDTETHFGLMTEAGVPKFPLAWSHPIPIPTSQPTRSPCSTADTARMVQFWEPLVDDPSSNTMEMYKAFSKKLGKTCKCCSDRIHGGGRTAAGGRRSAADAREMLRDFHMGGCVDERTAALESIRGTYEKSTFKWGNKPQPGAFQILVYLVPNTTEHSQGPKCDAVSLAVAGGSNLPVDFPREKLDGGVPSRGCSGTLQQFNSRPAATPIKLNECACGHAVEDELTFLDIGKGRYYSAGCVKLTCVEPDSSRKILLIVMWTAAGLGALICLASVARKCMHHCMTDEVRRASYSLAASSYKPMGLKETLMTSGGGDEPGGEAGAGAGGELSLVPADDDEGEEGFGRRTQSNFKEMWGLLQEVKANTPTPTVSLSDASPRRSPRSPRREEGSPRPVSPSIYDGLTPSPPGDRNRLNSGLSHISEGSERKMSNASDASERKMSNASETVQEYGLPRTVSDVRKSTLKELFRQIDVDGSGTLDRAEVARMARLLDKRMSDAELDAAMKSMDDDESGEVDFAEFSAWWKYDGGRTKHSLA